MIVPIYINTTTTPHLLCGEEEARIFKRAFVVAVDPLVNVVRLRVCHY